MTDQSSLRPGRPRSAAAHQAVLDATLGLLRTTRVRDLTIEGIAFAAKVGKPTIYRWWPSKNAIVVEAVFRSVEDKVAYPEAGSTESTLIAQVGVVAELLAGDPGRRLAELVGEGQSDPQTLATINERFVAVRREAARKLIQRGKDRGEIAQDVDPDIATDLIYGPLYYRLLFGHLPLDPQFAETAVRYALHGLSDARER
jgi:AcrR family transcriptional regulator